MHLFVLHLGLIVLTNTQTSSQAPGNWTDRLSLATALESVVGSGSFISNSKADDPYYSSSLSVTPSWEISEALSISANISLSYEWTVLVTPCHSASGPRPDGAPQNDCSDTNDASGRRQDWSDLRFDINYDQLYEIFGIDFSAGGGISLPTSIASRALNNIVSLHLNGQLSREFGPLSINLGIGGMKFFATSDAASLDAEALNINATPIGHCPSYRQTNCILLSGFVPNWRLGSDLSLSIEVPGVENLSASIGVSYLYSSRYGREPDEFSSTNTDADNKPIVDGTNSADTTSGYLEVTYEITKQLSTSIGISSGQPARTEDGRNLRFPFYDFISPANNYSGYYLSFSHSI